MTINAKKTTQIHKINKTTNRIQQHTKRKTQMTNRAHTRNAKLVQRENSCGLTCTSGERAKPNPKGVRACLLLLLRITLMKENPCRVCLSPAKSQAPSLGKRQLDPSKRGAEEAAHLSSSSNLKNHNRQRGPSRTGHIHSRLTPWAEQPWRGWLPDAWVGDTGGVIRGSTFKPKQILRGSELIVETETYKK